MGIYRGYGSEADLSRFHAIGCSLHLSVVLLILMILPIDKASYVSLHPVLWYAGTGKMNPYPIARSTRKISTNEKVFCAYFYGCIYDGFTGKLCR